MATLLTTTELRNMTLEDLRHELQVHSAKAAKIRMDIELKKEKDTAKYRRERRAIARMQTVIAEKAAMKTAPEKMKKEELKKEPKTRTVRAPKKS